MSTEIIIGGLLRAVGAFYALGGLLVLWGTLASALAEQATAKIELTPLPAVAVWRTRWLAGSAVLLVLCGLALAALWNGAGPLFLLSMSGQSLYLAVLAPRLFDPAEPPDSVGRRGTRNALAVFSLATAAVLYAWSAGWLVAWQKLPTVVLGIAVGLALFVVAYAVRNLRALL